MYELAHPYYFYLLLAVPVVVLIYLVTVLWKRRTRKKFGDIELLQQLTPERSKAKPVLKLILVLIAIASLSVALVDPKIGTRLETVKRKGVDIVFALDVSKSMLAEDIVPSRMEKAKQLVSRTLDKLVSDRVGIIIYAARAYPQLPITTDYGAARLFLKNVNTDLIPSQGTALADAIDLATEYYNDEDQKNRVLILLTDGEDHENGYLDAAEEAKKAGIRIFTIGIGTEQGAPIPINQNGYNAGYKKDRQGNVVVSKMHPDVLKKIADATNGEYINGANTRETVEKITDALGKMQKKDFESKVFAEHEDQFQWFLGLALLLLILDVFILERKTQWFKRLGLFEEEEKDED